MFVYVTEDLVDLRVLRVEVWRSDSLCTVLYMRDSRDWALRFWGLATLVWTRDLSLRRLLDDSLCRRTAQLFAVPTPIHGCLLEDGGPRQHMHNLAADELSFCIKPSPWLNFCSSTGSYIAFPKYGLLWTSPCWHGLPRTSRRIWWRRGMGSCGPSPV